MTKRSLHFGLNRVDPAAYGNWSGYLAGCWNDAVKTAALMATAGYEARAFFDDECTLDKARRELGDAAIELVDGDHFVFSDSGHGSQYPGPWNVNEEGLCLFDGILMDSEFRHLLAQFKPGVNVTCILDTCHAGGLDRGMARTKSAPLRFTRDMPGERYPYEIIPANTIIFGACERDELSGDGDRNGVFTGSILETITNGATWRSWMKATQRYMSPRFSTQHPELIEVGGSGRADQLIAV